MITWGALSPPTYQQYKFHKNLLLILAKSASPVHTFKYKKQVVDFHRPDPNWTCLIGFPVSVLQFAVQISNRI